MPPEKFVADFLATLKAGVIPRRQFIPWDAIAAKVRASRPAIEFFSQITPDSLQDSPETISDALLSADDPVEYVTLGFELLGHTADTFVTFEDNASVEDVSRRIQEGDETAALWVVAVWRDLGLGHVLRQHVPSALVGVHVGLACNLRKNLGGSAFGALVEGLLRGVVKGLKLPPEALQTERRISLGRAGHKRVDFCLDLGPRRLVAFEVNFYTVSGSKPTEIKRAYADLNRNLERRGITLVWITDGIGYRKMRRSLRDAFAAHPNTYNYDMASRFLRDDLAWLRGMHRRPR